MLLSTREPPRKRILTLVSSDHLKKKVSPKKMPRQRINRKKMMKKKQEHSMTSNRM